MWEGLAPVATEQALGFQARNPSPVPPPRPSAWSQAGELLLAPVKGLGQAAAETGRKLGPVLDAYGKASAYANAAADDAVLGRPSRDIEQVRGETIGQLGDSEWIDAAMRRSLESLKPDPFASTVASQVLQGGVRVISKALGYTAAGGPVGGIVGTGLDEGVTEYQALRDKGVDPATAAKVGAVHGGATALGVALPVAGRSVAATLALIGASGPGAYIAEQGLSQIILENANYPELAAERDPFDLVGLGVATLLPGTFGALAHRARVRAAKADGAPVEAPTPQEQVQALADVPELRDAAHVHYADHVRELHNLGDRSDPAARVAHAEALEAASRAMEAGEAVHVGAIAHVDPARVARVADELVQRLRGLDEQMGALRSADVPPQEIPAAPAPSRAEPVDIAAPAAAATTADAGLIGRIAEVLGLRTSAPAAAQAAGSPLERAAKAIEQRPELPVRLDSDGDARAARDLLADVRRQIADDKTDSRAFQAAVECFIKTGS